MGECGATSCRAVISGARRGMLSKRGVALGRCMVGLRILLALGALASLSLLGACASTDAASGKPGATKTSTAVPANYRQLMARHILENVDRGKVLKAEISRPGVWESPIGIFEPKPIACARWLARGPIIDQTFTLAFTFENGKIADTFDPTYVNPAMGALSAALLNAVTCGKLAYSSFPELMKGKK